MLIWAQQFDIFFLFLLKNRFLVLVKTALMSGSRVHTKPHNPPLNQKSNVYHCKPVIILYIKVGDLIYLGVLRRSAANNCLFFQFLIFTLLNNSETVADVFIIFHI